MTITLYLDEDSQSGSLVQALRLRGADVVTALEAGMLGRTDLEQLEWATAHGRVLYSFNIADFYRLSTVLSRQENAHAGIILARQQQYSVGEQMRRLLKLIASTPAEKIRNRVEFLSAWG